MCLQAAESEEEEEKTEASHRYLSPFLPPLISLHTFCGFCMCLQAEESEEEEEEKTEASYDYLSPFLPPLIGMQQLSREQAFEVRSYSVHELQHACHASKRSWCKSAFLQQLPHEQASEVCSDSVCMGGACACMEIWVGSALARTSRIPERMTLGPQDLSSLCW